MSISNHGENAILNAIFNNASLAVAARWVQVHTGDPGEDGTANVADTDRQELDDAAAAGSLFTSVNQLDWTAGSAETYTHVSVWDDPVAGNCWWTGQLTSTQPVNIGNTFTIVAGDLTASVD